MAKSFTEIEKDNIRKRLISECELNWSKYGYKKLILMNFVQNQELQRVLSIHFLIQKKSYFLKY